MQNIMFPSFVSYLTGASHAFKLGRILKLIHLLKLLRLSRIIRGVLLYEEIYRLTTTVIRYIKLVKTLVQYAPLPLLFLLYEPQQLSDTSNW